MMIIIIIITFLCKNVLGGEWVNVGLLMNFVNWFQEVFFQTKRSRNNFGNILVSSVGK